MIRSVPSDVAEKGGDTIYSPFRMPTQAFQLHSSTDASTYGHPSPHQRHLVISVESTNAAENQPYQMVENGDELAPTGWKSTHRMPTELCDPGPLHLPTLLAVLSMCW